ncbi:hypothetical protein [Acetilactobacillus jinshanensis]|uniref:Uncharacterized protein n=1 Tax=Acetilactobacillus jinshanensis TaxID=1720083 RepID=A0A4V1ALP8_9LACO|nr:hypothetical protein [Acetilactobacillus jinshanensis]QBP18349.1 hypothetical protein ELX58_04185 [Acetilactobacillus jinshanensis]URL61215.1 hypothetical protein HGK75_04255 [uncultured bacterium]
MDSKRMNKIRAKKQAYPKFQLKMEDYQLKLNHAANMGDMKNVGKYTMLINKIWDKHYKEWHL